MSLGNCKNCGKLYLMERSLYCEDCTKEQEELYRTARDYLKLNPNSTILDIHLKTGIPIVKLLEMKKKDYLSFK